MKKKSKKHYNKGMKKIVYSVFIFYLFCLIEDPGQQHRYPLHIFFNNWPDTDPSSLLDPLNNLVLNAKQSIECSFNGMHSTFPLDLNALSKPYQNKIQQTAENILKKRNEGISTSLVFNSKQKCTSTGALYFQYPGVFSNAPKSLTFQEIMADCNGLPNASAQNMKTGGFSELKQEIVFVNPAGKMMDNFCLIDKNKIWFSSQPMDDLFMDFPVVTFILEMTGNSIVNEFLNETGLLRNKISGSLKQAFWNPVIYELNHSKWKIMRGPQNKPVEYLTEQMKSTNDLYIFSSKINFSQTGFSHELAARIQNGKNTNMIFTDDSIFETDSFIQQFFISGGYCGDNPGFCSQNLSYINSQPGKFETHLFLFSDRNGKKRIVFYNGSLNATGTSSEDSVLIEIESDAVYKSLKEIRDTIYSHSQPVYVKADVPKPGEVLFNEFVWMGSITNSGQKKTSDEALELYNETQKQIDIGSMTIACTESGSSVQNIFAIPEGYIMQPHQYLVLTENRDGAFHHANLAIPGLSISNSTRECLFMDNRTPVSAFHPGGSTTGHYFDARLQGQIIDRALDYTGDPWNLYAADFFSKTGLNTLKYNISGEGARSMEKISPLLDGSKLRNWHMNTLTSPTSMMPTEYTYRTFASPGHENSAAPHSANGSVIINEIHYMGAYDSSGTSFAGDEFVELYNRSGSPSNIGGWIFGCSTDIPGAVGAPLFALPYGTIIQPREFMVIQRNGAASFLKYNFTFDFTLNNTITQCLLTDGSFTEANFAGSDSNGNGILEGHYDQALFPGTIADIVSDRSASLSSLSLGLNDAVNKIRRSCERISPDLPGNTISSWKSNSIGDPVLNTDIHFSYRFNTFATPGATNSP
ncbi:MAG: lamin tail domain-containing protein [Spirochaetia bacterium]|nr:lamin tail domain-containing protein [Spirochaetia bacterium]